MTVATETSTSLLTYAAGILAVLLWSIRKKMKRVRLGLAAILIGLDLAMKAPVWFLIARIDLTGSSSSYHRAELIDQFVNHFTSWWLIGTKDAATWGWGMWDAQNMYVSVGEAGGLAALVFYILVISRCFGRLEAARKRAKDEKQEWFLWFLRAALFANVVAFFGVNYFDQSRMAWFALVAMICACTAPIVHPELTLKSAESFWSRKRFRYRLMRNRSRNRSSSLDRSAAIFSTETHSAMNTQYVVVTPVRDEESYLPLTIDSMVKQTIRPQQWIIVNDGSKDSTGAIIDQAARQHSWIQAVHRKDRGFRKWGAGIIEAFYDGFNQLAYQDWDFMCKLDGDLSFEPDYFEKSFKRFAENSHVGIGGGILYHYEDGR